MSESRPARTIKSASSRVRSAIDRAHTIQQREQLRQTMIHKFHQDYARGNKKLQAQITQLIDSYFKDKKINELTLKELRQKVIELTQTQNNGQTDNVSHKSIEDQNDSVSVVSQSQRSNTSHNSQFRRHNPVPYPKKQNYAGSLRSSVSQSKAPKSVYVPDEEDEWAALIKFDTEMFNKEQELEAQRKHEFKRKMKSELDRQLYEKQRRREEEMEEERGYVQMRDHQNQVDSQREATVNKQKLAQRQNEKKQRDHQVQEEMKRKKTEDKKHRDMDNMLVNRIQQELAQEYSEQQERRQKEKDRQKQMLMENERTKKASEDQIRQDKDTEVDMQNRFIRLLDTMEEQREQERRDRENKIKRIMSSFATTVVKDQKDMLQAEDMKMLNALNARNQYELQDEQRKKENVRKQRFEIRRALDEQVDDKKFKRQEEQMLDKKQAEVWDQDLKNFQNHEQHKQDYIKNVNLRHQDILIGQMNDKVYKIQSKKTKMTPNELMQNQPIFKEMADKQSLVRINKVAFNKNNNDE